MSSAIDKHMKTIREQRQTLEDWTAYESQLDRFWKRTDHRRGILYDHIVSGHHFKLDFAERQLKAAANAGNIVDVSQAVVGHNVLLVCDPGAVGNSNAGSRQNARADILAMDFYRLFDRMTEAQTHVLTIPHITPPKPSALVADLALALIVPTFEPVVLASFEKPDDAMLYRLALQ